MSFAAGLHQTLCVRQSDSVAELNRGDSLEQILDRYLLAVEAMAETDLLTSILLLSSDGRTLSHGAAPNLPQHYRDEIDGSSIGPHAGSCGTAAHFGRAVHVADIATDPLWAEYRHLALPHGLRSCWSTPIRARDGSLIGTFAIYHRKPGRPTKDELAAIGMITEHVALAIMRARNEERLASKSGRPKLRIVADNGPRMVATSRSFNAMLTSVDRLEQLAEQIEQRAAASRSEASTTITALVKDSRKLADVIRRQVGRLGEPAS